MEKLEEKQDVFTEEELKIKMYDEIINFINELKKYFKGQVNGEVAAFMDSLKTRK